MLINYKHFDLFYKCSALDIKHKNTFVGLDIKSLQHTNFKNEFIKFIRTAIYNKNTPIINAEKELKKNKGKSHITKFLSL